MPDKGISASTHIGPVGPRKKYGEATDVAPDADPNAAGNKKLRGVHLHEYSETIWYLTADDPARTFDYMRYNYCDAADDWIPVDSAVVSVTGSTIVSQRNDGDYTLVRVTNVSAGGTITKYARGSNPNR